MPQDFKAAIVAVKQAYDIVDYIRNYGVSLKSAGVGKWKGNCAFHQEKTPSMVVDESFQNYRCFGCGANGDLFGFVTATENLSFVDALRKLADDKGIPLEIEEAATAIDYHSLKKILADAANFYCVHFDRLPDDHRAKQQILDRGLTFDNSSKESLKYGYSPAGNKLYEFLSRKYSDEMIELSGLCRRSDNGSFYDFFRSRLMFIFTDRYGKPIGFSSRRLFDDDTRGKYVNSSDSPLFHKNQVLYNHSLARVAAGKEKALYICEGQFDVAAFVEAGAQNVVAASGTAYTKNHVQECLKMVGAGGKLVFCFDGDEAGLAAASKVFTNFPEAHEASYVVTFPQGEDPCDYRLKNGGDALLEYVKKPQTLVEFMIQRERSNHDLNSPVGVSTYIGEVAKIIKTVQNLTLRDRCLRIVSVETLTPIDEVRAAVDKASPMKFSEVSEGSGESVSGVSVLERMRKKRRRRNTPKEQVPQNDSAPELPPTQDEAPPEEYGLQSEEPEDDDYESYASTLETPAHEEFEPTTTPPPVYAEAGGENGAEEDEDEEWEDEEESPLETLKRLSQQQSLYNVACRFVSLGLQRNNWRGSLVRSKELLPKEFYSFIDELETLSDSKVLFPEMFSDFELANFFMRDNYSTFYQFMELTELRDHFVYLHDKLSTLSDKQKEDDKARSVYLLLKSNPDADTSFFKQVLERAESSAL